MLVNVGVRVQGLREVVQMNGSQCRSLHNVSRSIICIDAVGLLGY